jgi:hypothetical protein
VVNDRDEDEVEERVCCPDDLCTGALDRTGRCGTCERTFAQYARGEAVGEEVAQTHAPDAAGDVARDEVSRAEPDEGEVARDEGAEDGATSESSEDAAGESREDERVCCPDDLCTGVIGADGRCGTCGRAANDEGAPSVT